MERLLLGHLAVHLAEFGSHCVRVAEYVVSRLTIRVAFRDAVLD